MNDEHVLLGTSLSEAGFGTVLDAARTACAHPYAAWLEEPLPHNILNVPQGMMVAPVHQGRRCSLASVHRLRALVDRLADADVVRLDGGEVQAGKWQLTAYKGILAARDTPAHAQDPKVYVGEDSLHFVDWVSCAPHAASALDIGAGSGISSVALSRRAARVTAVDIDADCCQAVPFTAALNGAADRIETVQADAAAGLELGRRFDIVVGNTPGVPIPAHIRYSPAGNGGGDGLHVSRRVLEQLPELLSKAGVAMLKFESSGDDAFPKAQHLLKDLAQEHGWSALYVQHSRIPMEVRAAISARWAAPLNPQCTLQELLQEFDRHSVEIGATQFYTCSVQIRARGDGQLTALPVYGQGDWVVARDVRPVLSELGDTSGTRLEHAYLERVRALPDGLWELKLRTYLFTPLARATEFLAALRDTDSFGAGVRNAFARELQADPVHARCLYVLAAILLDASRATR